MTTYSPTLIFAWDIAAGEAANANSPFIEPEHLFIGLCKLEDFASVSSLRDLGFKPAQAETMQPEIESVLAPFYRLGLSPTNLRRLLRKKKTTGILGRLGGWTTGTLRTSGSAENGVIHRSPRSRHVFARAESLANAEKARETASVHLLIALLEDATGGLGPWLEKHEVDVSAFRGALGAASPGAN